VHVEHRHRLGAGQAQRLRLRVAAVEHLRPHGIGHLPEQRVALLVGHLALADDLVEQDLDVHLVI
jgi:hypothetical protein